MLKLILIAVPTVAALVTLILRLFFSPKAKRTKLLKKVRKLENEMAKYPVGSDKYRRLRAEWLRLNRQQGDAARCN